METVGILATALAAVVLLVLVYLVIVSLPDIARYRRIRGM
jgi:hypothetical protein